MAPGVTAVTKLYKCQACGADCFESAAKEPACPHCRSHAVLEAVAVHFHRPGSGYTRACDDKPVGNGHATGLASCVTCPKCRATFDTDPTAPELAEV